MDKNKYWEKTYYIKVKELYVQKMSGMSATLQKTNSNISLKGKIYSEDKQEIENVIADNLQAHVRRLVEMGFNKEDISIEVETTTTNIETDKVEVVENEVDGRKVYSMEKKKSKISSGMMSIDLNGIGFHTGGALVNGISMSPNKFSGSLPAISTEPPHWTTWEKHPNTEELNEYDIVKFHSYFPHMNVKSGDMAVVVKVDIDTVMVKKDGSTFPIARHHISKVKN